MTRYSNIPVTVSQKNTGCAGLTGGCRINLLVTAPAGCPALLPPYPVVFNFAGYRVSVKRWLFSCRS